MVALENNKAWAFTSIFLFLFCIQCVEEEEPCADPAGTVTTYIDNNTALAFSTGSVTTCAIAAGNLYFSPFNFAICGNNSVDGIIGVGQVSCLGDVTTKPATGYTSQVAVELGFGYVVKLKNGNYARVYAEDWKTTTSGGVSGVKVKWQYIF